jgi:hypothetical protein
MKGGRTEMVSAVVLADFTADGVEYQKGQKITIPAEQYDKWAANKWVGPGSDPKTGQSWVGPGSQEN